MKRKALGSKVEMDTILSEAFFAFYWLSSARGVSSGMSGSIEQMIQLTEMTEYHKVFSPRMDLEHFIRVVRSADNEYMKIQAEKLKNNQRLQASRSKK